MRASKGGFSFIHIHDGSCFDTLQAIANGDLPNYADEICEIQTGCSVRITGELVESKGKGQDREIQAAEVEVVGWVDDPSAYPVAKKRHTFEYLRSVAHLRPRTNTFGAIARVRNAIAQAIHGYFNRNDFLWINTPIITASDCEGAGELFRVSKLDQLSRTSDYSADFFGTETFLTVSGQLNVEAFCCSLNKVYTFGPTFRAENSNTSRHLAEFWMIEPEIAFADLQDNAALAEDFLKSVSQEVLETLPDDMQFFADRIDKTAISRLTDVIEKPFEQLDYGEAIDILKRSGRDFEFPVEWGLDLQSEHERFLTEEHVGGPVIVVNFPRDIKAFYMRANDDGKNRCGDGRAGPRRGGNHRRQSARGAAGDAGSAPRREELERRALVVSGSATLWDGTPRRIRPRLRASGAVCDRNGKHPRCLTLSAGSREREFLMHADEFPQRSRSELSTEYPGISTVDTVRTAQGLSTPTNPQGADQMSSKTATTSQAIHDLLARRWSPRAFDPDKAVDRETLTSLFEAGRWAPSCFNDQPWRYLVWNRLGDKTAWDKAFACLVPGNQAWVRNAPILIAAVAGSEFAHNGKPNRWGQYDTGAASENMCLQATALGLSIHQMGGFDADALEAAFQIPAGFTPMAMMAVGYPGDPETLDERYREGELAARERLPLGQTFFDGAWEAPFT